MLTAQRLEPTITSVEMLRNMNATVGYCNGSLVNHYLNDVLGFKRIKVNSYNSTHRYAEALNSGEIAAIFLEVPVAKVFLAQYCKSFIRTGEKFEVGGFGFAFPKKYSWLSEANKALMNVTNLFLMKMRVSALAASQYCLTGGASTVALVMYVIMSFREFKQSNPELTNSFKLISAFMKDQRRQM